MISAGQSIYGLAWVLLGTYASRVGDCFDGPGNEKAWLVAGDRGTKVVLHDGSGGSRSATKKGKLEIRTSGAPKYMR